MKTRCPCCGATASLEVLITHDEARSLMVALAGISDELAKAALRYLGLFRPGERDLSWARAAKLLGELVPLIQAGEITRKRQSYPAPREAWIWAFNRVLDARDNGRLSTPLKSHGYLYEIIAGWAGNAVPVPIDGGAVVPVTGTCNPRQASKTLDAVAQLEEMKHG
ncbi:hypothetical protein A7P84_04040 [Eikenella corrodens]|uniref:hypothetical protein n=1 Tax=Eikenella corrodens TaxID=539 RepID=UPI0007D05CF9|nr:hypothetical protein [Eikenella corrodens]OAM19485.1 hypothetical protein A7P84_04040 [Eikenella corrodens]